MLVTLYAGIEVKSIPMSPDAHDATLVRASYCEPGSTILLGSLDNQRDLLCVMFYRLSSQ